MTDQAPRSRGGRVRSGRAGPGARSADVPRSGVGNADSGRTRKPPDGIGLEIPRRSVDRPAPTRRSGHPRDPGYKGRRCKCCGQAVAFHPHGPRGGFPNLCEQNQTPDWPMRQGAKGGTDSCPPFSNKTSPPSNLPLRVLFSLPIRRPPSAVLVAAPWCDSHETDSRHGAFGFPSCLAHCPELRAERTPSGRYKQPIGVLRPSETLVYRPRLDCFIPEGFTRQQVLPKVYPSPPKSRGDPQNPSKNVVAAVVKWQTQGT